MSRHRTTIFQGAVLTVGMRWTDRFIGFVSTIILARLLVPEDFGIIAMASLVINLVDVFLDLGVNVALIQNRNATQAHYDTAWTLRLGQTGVGTLTVVLAAPLAAAYFKDSRVAPVLAVLAFSILLSGFENIGVVAFQKDMQFGLDFRFVFLKRIAGFAATMAAAWLLRSYWALVIGNLFGRACGVGLSYWLHPMRPRLSIEMFGEIFAVSQWMLVRSIGAFLQSNLHRLVVGRWAPAATMGAYTLADEISAMPSAELLAPLNRVLFPAFAEVKHDVAELKRIFLLAQGVQTLVAIPAGIGLALVANEAVRVLLGESWMSAVPFVQVLALVNVIIAITASGSLVMISLGRMRTAALLSWVQVGLFMAGALLISATGDALDIAWLRLLVAVAGPSILVWLLLGAIPELRLSDILGSAARPILAAGAMVGTTLTVSRMVDNVPPVVALLTKIGTGSLTYATIVLLLWCVAGRPVGAESYLLEKLGRLYRLRGRNRALR